MASSDLCVCIVLPACWATTACLPPAISTTRRNSAPFAPSLGYPLLLLIPLLPLLPLLQPPMASLQPGMLLHLLHHLNSDSTLPPSHRPALLQIVSIFPSLPSLHLSPDLGFHLKVADGSHSMFVTVSLQQNRRELDVAGKLRIGQFLCVERLEPGSPFPRLVGIKPLHVRHSSVLYAEELEGRVSQIPQKKVAADVAIGRSFSKKTPLHSGGGKTKTPSGEDTACKSLKPRAPSAQNCLAQETDGSPGINDQRKTLSEIRRRECCAAVQKSRDFDSRQTAPRTNPYPRPLTKASERLNAVLTAEHDLPRYNAFLFEKTPSKCHSEVQAKAVACPKSQSKRPIASALSRSKPTSSKDEVRSNQVPTRKEPRSRNSTVGCKFKDVFSPELAGIRMPRQDAARNGTPSVLKQDTTSKQVEGTGRLHTSVASSPAPQPAHGTIAWNVVSASVVAIAEDAANSKSSAVLTAIQALREASAAECLIRNVRVFAEMCSLSKPEFPRETMRKYFKFCKSLELAKSTSDGLANGLRTDHLVALSNDLDDPHELHREMIKGAAAWVAMALSHDLFYISSSTKRDNKGLDTKNFDRSSSMLHAKGMLSKGYNSSSRLRKPLSDKSSAWKVLNTSVKRETNAKPRNDDPEINVLPCFESDTIETMIKQLTSYLQMKEDNSEGTNWVEGRRARVIADSAQKLQCESQKWFFTYLEKSLDRGFHLNVETNTNSRCTRKAKKDEVLADTLPYLKEVNDWIGQLHYESLDSNMLNVLEKLKKRICQFLFQHLDPSILRESDRVH